jgi:predicted transcriptional regulator
MEKMQESNDFGTTSALFDGHCRGSNIRTFEPSIRVLKRILEIVLSENGKNRTALAQQANLNYCRLSRHIEWLESKKFARLIVKDGKIRVILTESGVLFAIALVSKTEE